MPNLNLVVAVEDPPLREAVLAALREGGACPTVLPPGELLATGPDEDTFVILNTGGDVERLVSTATALYDAWSARGFDLRMRAYSPARLASDDVVFRLWRIGPELTVTVGTYTASDGTSIAAAGEEIVRLVEHLTRKRRKSK